MKTILAGCAGVGIAVILSCLAGSVEAGVGDFGGGTGTDMAVYDESSGAWYVRSLASNVIVWGRNLGGPGQMPVSGDYDGDGTNELAIYDSSVGYWYVQTLGSNVLAWGAAWGGSGLIPVPGDYDGDRTNDLAVYDRNGGLWFVRGMHSNVILWAVPWGGAGLIPVPGDYNGDGISDLAVYAEAGGQWFVRTPGTNNPVLVWAKPWGGAGLTPVPGDYDGDGKSDLAVYHESSGGWYVATTGQTVLAWAVSWGGSGLDPVAGDFDGDGRADFAVYDGVSGRWYIASLSQISTMQSDLPAVLSARGGLQAGMAPKGVLAWALPWGGSGLIPVTPMFQEPTLTSTNDPASTNRPDLGTNASFHGRLPFPGDNPWNQRVDTLAVDPNSDAIIDRIGRSTSLHPDFGAEWLGRPFGIPYRVVASNQARVTVTYMEYGDESDPGPFPIPLDAPIEGGSDSDGDRHVLVVDRDNWILYELYHAYVSGGGWQAGCGAKFDLGSNDLRPAGWTSADAAGLPIFPGLVRYDEVVEQGEIRHAIRFTCYPTRRGYISPARHYASSETDPLLPPMGMRVRLKAGVDISGYPAHAQVILLALKTYGMILADNGSDWFFTGVADARWNDEEMNTLKQLTGGDFEVIQMGTVVTE
ncbi:MAG: VCBS repeat-containing protein [Lentisphaerae bacterium]|nr:VCBS repeat-containing protein [Lentisphaerota bacterium]